MFASTGSSSFLLSNGFFIKCIVCRRKWRDPIDVIVNTGLTNSAIQIPLLRQKPTNILLPSGQKQYHSSKNKKMLLAVAKLIYFLS